MAASSSSTKKPSSQFYDIIVEPLDQGIKIPLLFMKRYGKCLEESVLVNVPDGIQWKVDLQVINGETWMKKGFQEFAEFYCVRKFSLLVFRYEDNSRFTVSIFDITSTEIDYSFKLHPEFRPVMPQDPEFVPATTVKCEEEEEEEEDEGINEGSNSVPEMSENSVFEVSDHEGCRRRETTDKNVGISCTVVNGRRLRKRSEGRKSGRYMEKSSDESSEEASDHGIVMVSEYPNPGPDIRHFPRRYSAGEGTSDVLGKEKVSTGQSSRDISRPTSAGEKTWTEYVWPGELVPCQKRRRKFRPTSASGGASKVSGKEKLIDAERHFPSEHPFFACSLNPTVTSASAEISVPTPFFQEHFVGKLIKGEEKDMQFKVRLSGQERMFPVTITKRKRYGRLRGRGWKQFVEVFGLKGGDIWMFELVAEEQVFNLHKCG